MDRSTKINLGEGKQYVAFDNEKFTGHFTSNYTISHYNLNQKYVYDHYPTLFELRINDKNEKTIKIKNMNVDPIVVSDFGDLSDIDNDGDLSSTSFITEITHDNTTKGDKKDNSHEKKVQEVLIKKESSPPDNSKIINSNNSSNSKRKNDGMLKGFLDKQKKKFSSNDTVALVEPQRKQPVVFSNTVSDKEETNQYVKNINEKIDEDDKP